MSRHPKGFTLIELLVALMIASVVFASLLSVLLRSSVMAYQTGYDTEAARVAVSVIDAVDRGIITNSNKIFGRDYTTQVVQTETIILTSENLKDYYEFDFDGSPSSTQAMIATTNLDIVWRVEIAPHASITNLKEVSVTVSKDSLDNSNNAFDDSDEVLDEFTTLLADGKRGQ